MWGRDTRRGFLKTSLSSATILLSQQQREERTPNEIWTTLTTENWGYTRTGLEDYHEKTGDFGSNRDILIIDTGFDADSPILNLVGENQNPRENHLNIHSWKEFTRNFIFEEGQLDDKSGQDTRIARVVW